jgi:protein scribble
MLQAIFVSKITEGGVAEKDGKLLVGDKVISVSCSNFYFLGIYFINLTTYSFQSKFNNSDLFNATFLYACFQQINGVDVQGARHDQAVSMLKGLERFVRLVVERERWVPAAELGTDGSATGNKVPHVFGVPKPYTGLYSANSYMANRPNMSSYRRPNLTTSSPESSTNYKLQGLRNDAATIPDSVTRPQSTDMPPKSPLSVYAHKPMVINPAPVSNPPVASQQTGQPSVVVPPQPAPRRITSVSSQSELEKKEETPAIPAPVPKPITNEEFQAMIPPHFLNNNAAAAAIESSQGSGPLVTVTIRKPDPVAQQLKEQFPPPSTAPGKLTETIVKSLLTETVVTRITDNKLKHGPLIIEVSHLCQKLM